MKVIVIREDNHGIIGTARCEGEQAKWAVELLIKRQWLTGDTDIYHEAEDDEACWDTVRQVYGEYWKDFMKNLSIDDFNEIWEGCFYLEVWDIYGVDNATIW
jgi:hypothetical protein